MCDTWTIRPQQSQPIGWSLGLNSIDGDLRQGNPAIWILRGFPMVPVKKIRRFLKKPKAQDRNHYRWPKISASESTRRERFRAGSITISYFSMGIWGTDFPSPFVSCLYSLLDSNHQKDAIFGWSSRLSPPQDGRFSRRPSWAAAGRCGDGFSWGWSKGNFMEICGDFMVVWWSIENLYKFISLYGVIMTCGKTGETWIYIYIYT